MSDLSFEQVIELLVQRYFGDDLAAELPGKPNVALPVWDRRKTINDARESVRVFYYKDIPFTLRVAAPRDFRGDEMVNWTFSEKAGYAPIFAAVLWLSKKVGPVLSLDDMRCIQVKHGPNPSKHYVELTLWQTPTSKGVLSTELPTQDIWATDAARIAATLYNCAYAEIEDSEICGSLASVFSVWLYRTLSQDPTVSSKFLYTSLQLFVEVSDALSGFANVSFCVAKNGHQSAIESLIRYQLQQI